MTEIAEVGVRLKHAREARGLSQVALAKRARVDQTTVSKAEREKLRLEESTAGRLADALGVSMQWLISGEGAGPTPVEESQARRIPAPVGVFDDALEVAFDKTRGHRLADVDAIRRIFAGETAPGTATTESLERAAARLLDAAAELRAAGEPITMPKVLMKIAS